MIVKLQNAWTARLKLRAEGDKLWAEMIIAVHGNITLEWKWRGDVWDCHLGTGEIFRGDQPLEGE